jgi:L-idonate 5-dehydrogenase
MTHAAETTTATATATAAETELPVSGPAVVAYAKGDLRIEEIPLKAPAADEAVVEVLYGGFAGRICITGCTARRASRS